MNTTEERLADTKVQFENAKIEVERAFVLEEELLQKSELLGMDYRGNEIVKGDSRLKK